MRVQPAVKKVIDLLKSQGLPYEVVQGKSHLKLYLSGRLAAVVSRGCHPEQGGRGMKNVEAAIRRAGRELRGQAA